MKLTSLTYASAIAILAFCAGQVSAAPTGSNGLSARDCGDGKCDDYPGLEWSFDNKDALKDARLWEQYLTKGERHELKLRQKACDNYEEDMIRKHNPIFCDALTRCDSDCFYSYGQTPKDVLQNRCLSYEEDKYLRSLEKMVLDYEAKLTELYKCEQGQDGKTYWYAPRIDSNFERLTMSSVTVPINGMDLGLGVNP